MPVICIYSPSHTPGEKIAQQVAEKLTYKLISDHDLFTETAKRFDITTNKLDRLLYGTPSVLDRIKHSKGKRVAYLRACLANLVKDDNVVYQGAAGHLLPSNLTHVLKVCLAAKPTYRVQYAKQYEKISEKEATKLMQKPDQAYKQWTLHLTSLGPWDKRLYDIIIPLDSTEENEAIEEILSNAGKPLLQMTPAAKSAMNDFLLAASINVELTQAGHELDVTSKSGSVTLIINRFVVRLESYQNELIKLVSNFPGVKNVKSKVGPRYHQPSIYPKLELPQKILLVDDEKEFVHTLSERLQTRNFEPVVAYNGEQALSMVQNDAPDVMVLDLKMPGIDGLEVLRRIKRERKHTEVIILTGHGSQQERQLAEELGAFAYLNKPVDIDVLSDTMKKAYAKAAEVKMDGPDSTHNGS